MERKCTFAARPRYPWKPWVLRNSPPSPNHTDTRCFHGDDMTSSSSEQSSSELNEFLFELERQDEESLSRDFNKEILRDVPEMVTATFLRLARKYPGIYGHSVVHLVGSVGEGTKVGVQDEFDFIVETPAQKHRLTAQKFDIHGIAMYRYRDPIDFDFCLDFVRNGIDQDDLGLFPTNRMYDYGITPPAHKESLVIEQLKMSLRPGWEVLPNLVVQPRKKAMLVSLRYFPYHGHMYIDVFCDIAFCFSVTWIPEIQCADDDYAARRLATQQTSYCLYDYDGQRTMTEVFMETDRLNNSIISEYVKRVYRLTKILTRNLLPQVWDVERNKFDGAIPSYWLKQILLYLMDEFPNPESWREANLGRSVTRMMLRLQTCLEKKQLFLYSYPCEHLMHDYYYLHENNFYMRYFNAMVKLLERANKGSHSAVESLAALCHLTRDFKTLVGVKAHLIELGYVVRSYKRTHPEQITNYIEDNFEGFVELQREGDKSVILINDEVADELEGMGLDEYIRTSLLDRPSRRRYKLFPAQWINIYDELLRQRMPGTDYLELVACHGRQEIETL